MLEILKDLKENYNVLAIKAEFEAEGSRLDELVMLNEIVFRADMNLIIKIGGCEAVRDLDQCRMLGVSGIMAPMIETPFAMQKFVGALNKVYSKEELESIEIIINAETKTCYDNYDEILIAGNGILDTVVVGRVDLSASMGFVRGSINDKDVFNITEDFVTRAKVKGFRAGFGGGISFSAIPFIIALHSKIDKFETRKVVFKSDDNEKRLQNGILKAMEFEVLYLKNKCDFYARMANEDYARMQMLEKRLNEAKETV
jgi:hypothetical protein